MAAGKAGQESQLSGFPGTCPRGQRLLSASATTRRGGPPQPPDAEQAHSVHLNQGSSIRPSPPSTCFQARNQLLLPGTPAVQLPSRLQPCRPTGRADPGSRGPHAGGQLIANPILTTRTLAGPLSLALLAPTGAHSARLYSLGRPSRWAGALPDACVSGRGSLPTQSQRRPRRRAATTRPPGGSPLPQPWPCSTPPMDWCSPPPQPLGRLDPSSRGRQRPRLPRSAPPLPLGLQQPQQQQQPPPQAPTPQAAAQLSHHSRSPAQACVQPGEDCPGAAPLLPPRPPSTSTPCRCSAPGQPGPPGQGRVPARRGPGAGTGCAEAASGGLGGCPELPPCPRSLREGPGGQGPAD